MLTALLRHMPLLVVVAVLLGGMGACRTRIGGGKAGEVATLARRVGELEREVHLQSLRAAEAEAKLKSGAVASGAVASEIALALPVLAGIEIDRLSGPTPADQVRFPVFVRTLDGRGRFVQAVGRLRVEVTTAGGDRAGPPVMVGRASLGPLDLREAYRSSVAGTHYRVDVVADEGFMRSPGFRGGLAKYDLRIVAHLEDALTGLTHETVGQIPARDRGR